MAQPQLLSAVRLHDQTGAQVNCYRIVPDLGVKL